MSLFGQPLLEASVFGGERVVRADVHGLRGAAGGQPRHADLVTGEHERAGKRYARLGIERRGVAVVVAREAGTGRRRTLRADRSSKLREDLHKEGAEIRLRNRPPDRDRALGGELDDLDGLAAHGTGGKSPCSRRYATTPPAARISCAKGASGRNGASPAGARSRPAARSSDTVSPSCTIATASADSRTGIPRLMQLRKKIRAKLFATIPPTPCFASAATAYSRELPHPKFSPPTRRSPAATSLAKFGRASQNAYIWNLSWPTMNGAYRPGTIWSVSRSSPNTQALPISRRSPQRRRSARRRAPRRPRRRASR